MHTLFGSHAFLLMLGAWRSRRYASSTASQALSAYSTMPWVRSQGELNCDLMDGLKGLRPGMSSQSFCAWHRFDCYCAVLPYTSQSSVLLRHDRFGEVAVLCFIQMVVQILSGSLNKGEFDLVKISSWNGRVASACKVEFGTSCAFLRQL